METGDDNNTADCDLNEDWPVVQVPLDTTQYEQAVELDREIEAARDAISIAWGGRISSMASDRLIFTSGGTEANNLALYGLAGEPPAKIVISAIEHPSVTAAAAQAGLRKSGFYDGPADGIWGYDSEQALRAWTRAGCPNAPASRLQ